MAFILSFSFVSSLRHCSVGCSPTFMRAHHAVLWYGAAAVKIHVEVTAAPSPSLSTVPCHFCTGEWYNSSRHVSPPACHILTTCLRSRLQALTYSLDTSSALAAHGHLHDAVFMLVSDCFADIESYILHWIFWDHSTTILALILSSTCECSLLLLLQIQNPFHCFFCAICAM